MVNIAFVFKERYAISISYQRAMTNQPGLTIGDYEAINEDLQNLRGGRGVLGPMPSGWVLMTSDGGEQSRFTKRAVELVSKSIEDRLNERILHKPSH